MFSLINEDMEERICLKGVSALTLKSVMKRGVMFSLQG